MNMIRFPTLPKNVATHMHKILGDLFEFNRRVSPLLDKIAKLPTDLRATTIDKD